MQIENFKIFADLVESESFSQSAKVNGVTQSAVSQQLRAMEKHFNVPIVDRSQKQFQLTREGQKLYDSTKDLLHRYDKLKCELLEMKKVISGTIRISTIYSIGLHELPIYVKKFLEKYPSVNLHVEYRRSNLVYEDIKHNSVDMGLVAYPKKSRQLEIIPFMEDEMVLICNPAHPLCKNKKVQIKDLAGCKLVSFEKDIPTRKATDRIVREAMVEINPIMEFDNIETIKRAVEINAGVSIVPKATVTQELRHGSLKAVPFKDRKFKRPLSIIYRKDRVLTPAMKKFIATLTGKSNPAGGKN